MLFRNLIVLLETQVSRVFVYQESLEKVRSQLEASVKVIKKYQELGLETWTGIFTDCAGIYRTFCWVIEKMTQMDLVRDISDKLQTLNAFEEEVADIN